MHLSEFFRANPAGALAFSGGTDSALLAWAAAEYGRDWRAYCVQSAFQPAFEWEDARRLAEQVGLPLTKLEEDVLADPEIAGNPPDRCYHCKRRLFRRIRRAALADGYRLLIDGTNASDEEGDRPGMRALRELEVRSPLRECGMDKDAVRAMSRAAGLFTWDKPAYACLATRIPTGRAITREDLARVEAGEALLRKLGFTGFRLRLRGELALLQVPEEQMQRALDRRTEITEGLRRLFPETALDLKARI